MAVKPRALLAGAVFAGALAAGGVSLAAAQTNAPSTPETTNPDATTAPRNNPYGPDHGRSHDGHNCPNMGGENGHNDTGSQNDLQHRVSPDIENSI
jgi:hypothetical protein